MRTCKNAAAPELWVKTLQWMRSLDNGLIQATRRQTSSGQLNVVECEKDTETKNPASITEEEWGSSRMIGFCLVCRMSCFGKICPAEENFWWILGRTNHFFPHYFTTDLFRNNLNEYWESYFVGLVTNNAKDHCLEGNSTNTNHLENIHPGSYSFRQQCFFLR